jgi:hypothetical protein
MLRDVSLRRRAIVAFALAVVSGSSPVIGAPGRPSLSARFLPADATIGRDLVLQIEVDDAAEVIQRAEVEILKDERAGWTKQGATRSAGLHGIATWSTTFTSTTVWEQSGRQPERILVRAKLYGRRGGLILSLGELDPLEVDVLSPSESEARARIFKPVEAETNEFRVVGYAGGEVKAGTASRLRGVIGVGGGITPRLEVLAYVSVGPSFNEPRGLADGGPLTLGFELSLRAFTRRPGAGELSLFAEPFAMIDLRLPGVDPGVGLRAGVQIPLGRLVELEAAIGGAMTYFTIDPTSDASQVGFTGGARFGLRFGGDRPPEETK